MSEDSEFYRRNLLVRLEREDKETQDALTQLQQKDAKTQQAMARLKLPLPQPDACPQCFYLHGNVSILKAVTHPKPDKYDRMECKKCYYHEDSDA